MGSCVTPGIGVLVRTRRIPGTLPLLGTAALGSCRQEAQAFKGARTAYWLRNVLLQKRHRAPVMTGSFPVGLTGQDGWGAFELTWSRGPYRILSEPDRPWGAAWAAIPEQRVPFLDPSPPEHWVWVSREAPVRSSISGEMTRLGGPLAGETVNVF